MTDGMAIKAALAMRRGDIALSILNDWDDWDKGWLFGGTPDRPKENGWNGFSAAEKQAIRSAAWEHTEDPFIVDHPKMEGS